MGKHKLDFSPFFIIEKWHDRETMAEKIEVKTPFGELTGETLDFLKNKGFKIEMLKEDEKGNLYEICRFE